MRLMFTGLALAFSLLSGAAAQAADLGGVWAVDGSPSFPGVRLVQIHEGARPSGTMTTDWYGPMPLMNLRVSGEVASFEIHNGNPRLPVHTWTARLDGQSLRLAGDIWEQHVEVTAHRATPQETVAGGFQVQPMPQLQTVPGNGLARTPPMGWSSWNRFAERIDDATVRRIADAMVSSGLRDAGYVYVNIDDGWQGERDAKGELHPNAKFPDMRALADYLHARGLKLGLYSSPGPKTCAGFAGSYGHVTQDARTFAGWGVDYLKYDLCSGEFFYRTRDQIEAVYQAMGAALQASGRPIVFSLCEYGHEGVGAWGRDAGGNLWRTSRDIEDTYASMAEIGFQKGGEPKDAGPGGWNDLDMLEVGNGGMTAEEYRTHLSLWALQAAPLLMGNDVSVATPETIDLLTNPVMLAIDQDPLGRQGHRLFQRGDLEVWARPLSSGGMAVGLFNRGTAPISASVAWADLGLATAPARMQSAWPSAPVQSTGPTLAASLPAHGAALLQLN